MRDSGIPEVLQIVVPGVAAGALFMLVTVGPMGRLEPWPFFGALIATGVVSWLATMRVIRNSKR